MNLYKHLVHLKSTTGKQSVLSFCVQFWSFHLDILVSRRDPVCEPNQPASHALSNCDRSDPLRKTAAPCTEKVSHFGTTKPGVKETRETQLTQ